MDFLYETKDDESKRNEEKHDADYNNYGALSYIDTTLENASDEDKEFLEKRLAYLRWIVTECKEEGIYVIFDLHVAPGGLNTGGYREEPLFFEIGEDGEARRECALRIWKLITNTFKDEAAVAGYDIINEPSCFNNGESEKYINVIDFYDEAYNVIREIDERHIIIMEGMVKSYSNSDTEISKETDDMKLPNPAEKGWNNVVYSKHDYFFNFRNQDEDKGMDEEWLKDNPPIETMKARINKSIEDTKTIREEYNISIWIGEFNCHAYYTDSDGNIVGTFKTEGKDERNTFNKEYTEKIWKYQIQAYESNNISYTAWTYKACWENYFGLVYYGRNSEIERIDLQTATYDDITKIFEGNSSYIMNYNANFHNIFKKQLQIFAGVDISTNGDGTVIAKLSNDKTTLTISGTGKMADFSALQIEPCETYEYNKLTVPPWYEYRSYITKVEIGENITNIGQSVFFNCSSIKDITIPNNLTTIGGYAFHNCNGIQSMKIPSSVTHIYKGAFYKCKGLQWVELGRGVSYIGDEVFTGSSSLKNIYVYASNEKYTAID